jgi:predicted ATPase
MINSISLHNFKCYQNRNFKLSLLTVFCGSNSVGKSTAIQALSIPLQSRFMNEIKLNGDLTEVGFIKDIHNKSYKDESLSIELTIDGSVKCWGYEDQETQKKEASDRLTLIADANPSSSEPYDKLLGNFQYLQAERFGPRNNADITDSNRFHNDWLGAKGEFTSEFLSQADNSRRLFVGGEAAAKECTGDARLHSLEENPALHKQINAWMKEISPGISVTSRLFEEASVAVNTFDQNGNGDLKPQNVGFGVSYVLSIVTALLYSKKGSVVIIENPEAHLHPKGQSYLGRLIALTAKAGIQVIVETHSDHLLNGIRVIARTDKDFYPSTFTLYYISHGEEESQVDTISISKDGKLSNWPEGFFDQQAQDMFTIMTGNIDLPRKEII